MGLNSDPVLVVLVLIAIVCISISAIHISRSSLYKPVLPRIILFSGRFENFATSLQRGLLYSFLPSLPFWAFSTYFINVDLQLRLHAPLNGLSTPNEAEKNLLLDYLSPDPATLVFKALSNSHYRIAFHAFLALLTNYSVLVAARIFNRQIIDGTVYMVIAPTNFYAALGILCFYTAIIPFSRPPITFATPRFWHSVLDTLSFVYDSRVLECPEFDVQDKTDEQKHFIAKCIVAKRKFCFGMYYGISGRRHMGIAPVGFQVAPVRGGHSPSGTSSPSLEPAPTTLNVRETPDVRQRILEPDVFTSGWAVGWPGWKWWSKRPKTEPIDTGPSADLPSAQEMRSMSKFESAGSAE
jgi:hypothetical protein